MNRITLIGGIAIGLAVSSIQSTAFAGQKLAPGEAQVIYTFEDESPYIAAPEGIAFDRTGNIYVSNRVGDPFLWAVNEIIQITPNGTSSILADLGPAAPGFIGLLGLTTDSTGNVYAAFVAGNESHGVWKISPDGSAVRLPGSDQIVFPNALNFDNRGNLYVTDSYPLIETNPGLIWRYEKHGGAFEVWASDDLLAPDPDFNPISPPPPAPPFDAPGANGIAFAPPNHIYVVNNEKSLILHVPILPDGSAGAVTIVAGAYPPEMPLGYPGPLFAPDGLSVDVKGNLYTVNVPAGFSGFPLSPVVRIYPATGVVEPVVDPLTNPSPLFDFPASLAFGRGLRERKSLFVVQQSTQALGMPAFVGPQITQVGVGVPGVPGQ